MKIRGEFKLKKKIAFILAMSLISVPYEQVSAAETSYRFDFGSTANNEGFISVDASKKYDKSLGYGFNTPENMKNVNASGNGVLSDAVQFMEYGMKTDNTFNVDLENGLYEVKVTLGNTMRTTVVAEDTLQLINMTGNNAVNSFKIPITDGQLNISATAGKEGYPFTMSSLEINKISDKAEMPQTIWVCGDSTVCNYYPIDTSVQGGWGQMLDRFVDTDVFQVKNMASGGQYAKGFYDSGQFESVMKYIKKGDYFIISIGINDKNYSNEEEYYKTVTEMTKQVKEKGGEVILVKQQGRANDVTDNPNLKGRWFGTTLDKIGTEQNVQVVDLFTLALDYYKSIGQEQTYKLYMEDDTLHVNRHGAIELARLFSSQVEFKPLKADNNGDKAGDLNNDGKINAMDYSILKHDVLNHSSENQSEDVNHDGNVDTMDVLLLKKYIFNLIDGFEKDDNNDSNNKPQSKTGRQVEKLDRGVSASYTGNGVLVSWRILGTDSENTTFKLFKNGEKSPVYEGTINDATCFLDTAGTTKDLYTIDTFVDGEMTEFAQPSINLINKNSGGSGAYMDIPLDVPAEQIMPDGTVCTYSANDCSVGDVDGDGQYEIIVKWYPSNATDNTNKGYTGTTFLDCYKLDGTKLWRINLGINIRSGAHYTQFMVYDFDGDGKAEVICKTADGTTDGVGKVIGDANADHRTNISGSNQHGILTGDEFLTLFDGETGKALDTIPYTPARGNINDWGDDYGNRVDRFLAGVAYLDGKTPSAIFCRGYYTRMAVVSYDVVDKKLVKRWTFDTGHDKNNEFYGQGNHSLAVADVDNDGKDEIVYGGCGIDDDGKGMYSTGFGHGDAMHVGDLVPEREGMEVYTVHEEKQAGYGASLRDAETGKILWKLDGASDTGRGIAGNFTDKYPGMEFTSVADNKLYYFDAKTNSIVDTGETWNDITKWGMNSMVWWTGDLERETLDRMMVDKYGKGRVFTGDGVTYNNASKSNACLTCDLFGDWREEIIMRTSDDKYLRVFATTYDTEYPLTTLMHDTQYRCGVAIENVGYNQPPNTSFFLGTDYDLPAKPEVYTP